MLKPLRPLRRPRPKRRRGGGSRSGEQAGGGKSLERKAEEKAAAEKEAEAVAAAGAQKHVVAEASPATASTSAGAGRLEEGQGFVATGEAGPAARENDRRAGGERPERARRVRGGSHWRERAQAQACEWMKMKRDNDAAAAERGDDLSRPAPAPRRSGSVEGSRQGRRATASARPPSDDGSVHGYNDKVKEIDVGVDRLYHELKQHQQYGGTPVGHIILRPGEDLATVLWGFVLLIGAFVFFVSSMYAILVSKIMPDTGNVFIDAIKADHYVRVPIRRIFVCPRAP